MKKTTLLLLFAAATMASTAAERVSFNADWDFRLGDNASWSAAEYDNDDDWRELDLPHDWSIEGEYAETNPTQYPCGYLPAGIGWYRKEFDVPKSWIGKQVSITFDGVFMNSTVWVDGEELGTRPYGWSSFEYLIPEQAKADGEIVVAVRVDNLLQPSARWYTGSGIYANTWIDIRESVHVPRSGVYVRTEGNRVIVSTEVKSVDKNITEATILSEVKNSLGKVLASSEQQVNVGSGATVSSECDMTLANANHWSPESPYLYTLVTTIKEGRKVMDVVETRFGVRDIEWKPESGMWLNGKNIKLQGVCNHADAGALGVAIPDKITRYRIQQMLDMGCNSIRTSHYPRTPEFYAMCDEMGMLVMDEVFDGWYRKAENEYAARFFNEWWERDLTDWLRRDRNHPSVVIWSVGNETHGEVGYDIAKVCHAIDPTRPITSGHAENDAMDLYGVNGASEQRGYIDSYEPTKVLIGTENTHTLQTRGHYRTITWYRDGLTGKGKTANIYNNLTEKEIFTNDRYTNENRPTPRHIYHSSYDNSTIRMNVRHNIQQLRDVPYFAGTYRWTGYDYIGEARYHGGWPFKGLASGAVDMANFPKDLYYLYKSQWNAEPMVHILPHWTHPNIEAGTEIPVWVYSNCDEVDLLFDGKSLGKIKPGKMWNDMQCEWLVPWKAGRLEAVGYRYGKEVAREYVATAAAPQQLILSVDGEGMASVEGDVTQVRVTVADANGEFYPWGENRNYFHVLGEGDIRALDNGDLADVETHYKATSRLSFNGLARAYVEADDAHGSINLLVGAILGEKRQLTSNKVAIDVEALNLRGRSVTPKIEIYYTTNGTNPTRTSQRYVAPFEVKLGTTVKALVIADNEAIWTMEERFAEDAGMEMFVEPTLASVAGDQAEDAKLEGATASKQGEGFVGQGFAEIAKEGGKVSWYYENDGVTGPVKFILRHSTFQNDVQATITINGKDYKVKLPATIDAMYRKYWGVTEIAGTINGGGNNITLTVPANSGVCIDELLIN